jgi:hypothetical protein
MRKPARARQEDSLQIKQKPKQGESHLATTLKLAQARQKSHCKQRAQQAPARQTLPQQQNASSASKATSCLKNKMRSASASKANSRLATVRSANVKASSRLAIKTQNTSKANSRVATTRKPAQAKQTAAYKQCAQQAPARLIATLPTTAQTRQHSQGKQAPRNSALSKRKQGKQQSPCSNNAETILQGANLGAVV